MLLCRLELFGIGDTKFGGIGVSPTGSVPLGYLCSASKGSYAGVLKDSVAAHAISCCTTIIRFCNGLCLKNSMHNSAATFMECINFPFSLEAVLDMFFCIRSRNGREEACQLLALHDPIAKSFGGLCIIMQLNFAV
ncbi:hypothetical protein VNO80_21170 [Phaseolus coccineus]|uniref:Uncharacterized protein n=1 Tax=Phaseolus coccineus TaxID=3886 RepID=A0AAN9M2L2_PHACN